MKINLPLAALALLCVSPTLAQEPAAPSLDVPIDCDPSATCSIQKYFDHDPGPGRLDYACGRLSLDGDTGTDFRLPNYAVMEEGVAVLAAADGVVRAVRDGMEDVSVRETGKEAVEGREAGNAVAIAHEDGWETQYSHLKKGSLRVKEGEAVRAGQPIGEVGLSGNTEFPHVEFTVRKSGVAVDPFAPGGGNALCGEARGALWSDAALEKLPYRPVVLLSSGFNDGPADANAARKGVYENAALRSDSKTLVFWADLSGTLEGDREQLTITDPDGRIVVDLDRTLEENNISWFVFAGLKRPEKGWRPGAYAARYTLSRNGETMAEETRAISLQPFDD